MSERPKKTSIAIVILVISLILIVMAIASSGYSLVQIGEGIEVEEEAVFIGTDGTISVEIYESYSVFVVDDYSCSDSSISIYEGEWEYFFEDCDPIMNEIGWDYVGYFSPDFNGDINIQSNVQIAIVDDSIYLERGGGFLIISGALCCFGVIGISLSIFILIFSRSDIDNSSITIVSNDQS